MLEKNNIDYDSFHSAATKFIDYHFKQPITDEEQKEFIKLFEIIYLFIVQTYEDLLLPKGNVELEPEEILRKAIEEGYVKYPESVMEVHSTFQNISNDNFFQTLSHESKRQVTVVCETIVELLYKDV